MASWLSAQSSEPTNLFKEEVGKKKRIISYTFKKQNKTKCYVRTNGGGGGGGHQHLEDMNFDSWRQHFDLTGLRESKASASDWCDLTCGADKLSK